MAGIFRVITHIEMPDSPGTVHFHYQNVTPSDSGKSETRALADAFTDQILTGPFQALLSEDCRITCCQVYKRALDADAAAPTTKRVDLPGLEPGTPLPAIAGLQIGIRQAVFPPNRNGKNWIPGISETNCLGNNWNQAFFAGPVTAFVAALGPLVLETPQAGQWRLGVFSEKFLDDSFVPADPGPPPVPEFRDYEGAFADAIAATASPIVRGVSSRVTHRVGVPA